ncbi:hypothetical protein N185_15675 [Sinorhizobium sp. GW3]|nr:hypothetical protein N185_15675 [Sinorhizobium sp. GW3]
MTAFIELRGLGRSFTSGRERFDAIRGINLDIERGEFVALMGSSGSGKSTLLSIIGCLDSQTSGTYRLAGQDVAKLSVDGLAELRRRHFGFVFQRYNLLSALTAVENVEVPAIYIGTPQSKRRERARYLLAELGLDERLDHRPMEMSGGQQQRVSIARALMNGGEIILADEPTGALDTKTGESVLALLNDLNQKGHTIIMVTHDLAVAQHAKRIVEISDGQVTSDNMDTGSSSPTSNLEGTAESLASLSRSWTRTVEAAKIAVRSIAAHRLRSCLTLFGIVVGILAVTAVVGLGEGGRRVVLDQINSLGANSISILPGRGWDDRGAKNVDSLSPDDVAALAKQPFINSVSPIVEDAGQLMFDSRTVDGVINGVSNPYFDVAQRPIASGTRFTFEDGNQALQEAIIDDNARKALFGDSRSPIGEILIVKATPFVIVGTIGKLSGSLGQDKRPQVFVPYTSLFSRISGPKRLSEIVVRVKSNIRSDVAEKAIIAFLDKRHGTRDFFTFNSDQLREAIETTTRSFSIFVASIAAIALLVGGVGVTNIMLVSISERTAEIGLRMAVGARTSDIRLQFLVEALAITAIGSSVGIGLAFGLGALLQIIDTPIPMVISIKAVSIACIMAVMTGAVFGFFPARRAAQLHPLEALGRD